MKRVFVFSLVIILFTSCSSKFIVVGKSECNEVNNGCTYSIVPINKKAEKLSDDVDSMYANCSYKNIGDVVCVNKRSFANLPKQRK